MHCHAALIWVIKSNHLRGSFSQSKESKKCAVEGISGVILSHAEAVALIKARLSRLQAGFWWTAIYHVEVKGRPNCPAYSMSGISPGRCLWDAATQLTEQQQVMATEWWCHGQCLPSYSEITMDGMVPVYGSLGQHSGLYSAKHCLMWKEACFHPTSSSMPLKQSYNHYSFSFPMTYLLSFTPLSSSWVLMWMHWV